MFNKSLIRLFNRIFPHPSQGKREVFTFYSEEVGDHFDIWVDLPDLPTEELKNLPVIVYTDANLPTARHLNPLVKSYSADGKIPPVLLVGIAHADSFLWKRNRDLIQGRKLRNGQWTSRIKWLGKAQNFYHFVRDELATEIRKRYSVSEEWTLLAHSFGASFALFSMLQFEEKPLFQKYLAISPAVWVYNRNLLKIARYFQAEGGQIKGQIFIGAGGLEAFNLVLYSAKAYFNFLQKEGGNQVKVDMKVYPWRDHFTGVKPAMAEGLLKLFENTKQKEAGQPSPGGRAPIPAPAGKTEKQSRNPGLSLETEVA